MTDLALNWNDETVSADLLLSGGALATDDGLRTTILISLFTDARASEDAELPEAGDDRRGWWGDQFAADAGPDAGSASDRNRIGSLLWLLGRAKATTANLQLARQATEAALGHLVRDGVASRVAVEVESQVVEGGKRRLALGVDIYRPNGPDRERYDFTWEASLT
ncbi:phage GP46 family protein [Novosphingobium naphthalenivorans]|uniref:phage GP46 family protein n=1 Tax=Novosphingobium naphthalenivorans TaxID=273168 RepID=UPI000833417F|nr:phage GP46 family protein [Novosphingobium naphthalenivorans]